MSYSEARLIVPPPRMRVRASTRFGRIHEENLARQQLVGRLDAVTRRLSRGAVAFFYFAGRGVRIAVVVLDSCRNNPLRRAGRRSLGAFASSD
jgi:hypothetical protein